MTEDCVFTCTHLWKASGEHLLFVLVRMILTKAVVRLSLNSFPITWPFGLDADLG